MINHNLVWKFPSACEEFSKFIDNFLFSLLTELDKLREVKHSLRKISQSDVEYILKNRFGISFEMCDQKNQMCNSSFNQKESHRRQKTNRNKNNNNNRGSSGNGVGCEDISRRNDDHRNDYDDGDNDHDDDDDVDVDNDNDEGIDDDVDDGDDDDDVYHDDHGENEEFAGNNSVDHIDDENDNNRDDMTGTNDFFPEDEKRCGVINVAFLKILNEVFHPRPWKISKNAMATIKNATEQLVVKALETLSSCSNECEVTSGCVKKWCYSLFSPKNPVLFH